MISIRHDAAVLVATGFAALYLGACGAEEKPAETVATPVAPTPQPDEEIRYSGTTEEGESFDAQLGGDVTLPEDYPKDVPLYPGATPSSWFSTGPGNSIVAFESEDQAAPIFEYFEEKLPANGWSVEAKTSIGAVHVVSASKGDRKLALNVERVRESTQISIMLSKTK